ncbi:hypothetical protein OYC64_005503 [Pagothenia borchgrevinki]|uniref:BED-type domain-containing protein n=1 Tax=Pagothenia borchgrevinki TaxID=8213 RepID=A0ABD2GFV1_PAGBO
MAESAITFEGWRYAHYFEFVRRIDRNVTVRCKLCPGQKLLSTAVNTTSNLNKHLQRTHAKVKLIAKDPRTQSEDVVSAPPPTLKRHKLEFGGPVTKAEMDRLVASFIVEVMLPICTVESPSHRSEIYCAKYR